MIEQENTSIKENKQYKAVYKHKQILNLPAAVECRSSKIEVVGGFEPDLGLNLPAFEPDWNPGLSKSDPILKYTK